MKREERAPVAGTQEADIWQDDQMGRKVYADFLTRYISDRITSTGKPLTAALDANWGTGKTFFVERWARQIESTGGASITFDAWKNDFAADPLLSFLAELAAGMKVLEKRCSGTAKVKKTLKDQTSGLLTSFRKAAIPAGAIILKSVAKKYAGDALEELADSGKLASFAEKDWEDFAGDVSESLEKGLEVFFKKAVEDHRNRIQSTEGFRNGLSALVSTLQSEKLLLGPLFIFIDELDRCRPDYSIRLLEGIKHMFAVPGVAFVISTNLTQLSKSVQGVYGPSFDGYNYLKRFFDFEFSLPDPDNYGFAQLLQKEQPIVERAGLDSGLSVERYKGEDHVARAFELTTSALDIPLRDQRQIWTIALAARSGIPESVRVHIMWLFFLSALKHSRPDAFAQLGATTGFTDANFLELCAELGLPRSRTIKARKVIRPPDAVHSRVEDEDIAFSSVLSVYRKAARNTLAVISKEAQNESSNKYPASLATNMLNEPPFQGTRPYISQYYQLVKMAGLLE